jgi:hypothetical protein
MAITRSKWVTEYVMNQTHLPRPFSSEFVLEHVAGDDNVTSFDMVNQVMENVRRGKKDGRVYGVYIKIGLEILDRMLIILI